MALLLACKGGAGNCQCVAEDGCREGALTACPKATRKTIKKYRFFPSRHYVSNAPAVNSQNWVFSMANVSYDDFIMWKIQFDKPATAAQRERAIRRTTASFFGILLFILVAIING